MNKRIILDGRDLLLSLQNRDEANNWDDNFNINLKDLTFEQLKEMRDKLKKSA